MTENKMNDNALVERLKAGDHKAIDEIVEKYKNPLFAFIIRMGNDHSTSEDIFQETWIKVIKHVGNFRGDAKFSTWLFQIARNLCIDAGRMKKRGVYVPIEDYEDSLPCEHGIDPFRVLKAKQVQRIVDSLPDKMKETVVLRYFHDFDEHEISEVLGCPVGTVKSRLYRATNILRKKWESLEHSYTRKKGNYETQ